LEKEVILASGTKDSIRKVKTLLEYNPSDYANHGTHDVRKKHKGGNRVLLTPPISMMRQIS
jgi:hypothetical protein